MFTGQCQVAKNILDKMKNQYVGRVIAYWGQFQRQNKGLWVGNYLDFHYIVIIPSFILMYSKTELVNSPWKPFFIQGVLLKQRLDTGCPGCSSDFRWRRITWMLRFCPLWNLMDLCIGWSCSSGHPQEHLTEDLNEAQSRTTKPTDLAGLRTSWISCCGQLTSHKTLP